MKTEWKICMPGYKLAYSLLFLGFLSLFRGVAFCQEIGGAILPYLAALAAVFSADTYQGEWVSRRGEVFSLLPAKSQVQAIYRRFGIQAAYLWLAGGGAYFCFFWQRPGDLGEFPLAREYGWYLLAILAAVVFWSAVGMTAANLLSSPWAGIGLSLALWLVLFSAGGMEALGDYGAFSYLSREPGQEGAPRWLWGVGISLALAAGLLALVPWSVKKRRG